VMPDRIETGTYLAAAAAAGLRTGTTGGVVVDDHMRTNVEHVYCIGDVTGLQQLAHTAMHQGVVAVDAGLDVRFANAGARALLGPALRLDERVPEPWTGLPLADFARGLFRDAATIAEARIDADGGRIISVVGVPAGASELAVIVVTDITERERRERAEREFVANASHELRTPVSAITGAVDALRSGASDVPEDRERFIELIGRQGARLGRLTRSLLVLARAQTREEPIQLEPVPIRPLLDDQIVFEDVPPAITIRVDCPSEVTALAQRDVAEQILSNLLGNALKHAGEGLVVVSARAEDETVVVEISDSGPGIEGGDRVFDRFYAGANGRRDGFGLGLAIVREAVRALGGRIEIESESGRGTTARVTLAATGP